MDQRAQERVAIARDALAWIQAGALIPTSGTYISTLQNISRFPDENVGKQLREAYLGTCQVCAKGALFLAKAVRYDDVTCPLYVSELYNQIATGTNNRLEDHFDPEQLQIIEYAFEGRYQYAHYRARHKTSLKCLKAILKNIIRNDGTFVCAPGNY